MHTKSYRLEKYRLKKKGIYSKRRQLNSSPAAGKWIGKFHITNDAKKPAQSRQYNFNRRERRQTSVIQKKFYRSDFSLVN